MIRVAELERSAAAMSARAPSSSPSRGEQLGNFRLGQVERHPRILLGKSVIAAASSAKPKTS